MGRNKINRKSAFAKMKTWIKACLIVTITFVTLITISIIIGYTIMTKQGQFKSEHHEPISGMYHNPEAEHMINKADDIASEFDNSKVHNLDDMKQKKFLK